MNVLGELETVLNLCQAFYEFYEELDEIDTAYEEIYNDVIILQTLLNRVKNSVSIPPEVNPCIISIGKTLGEVLRKLKKYQKEGLMKKMIRVGTKEVFTLICDLKVQRDRIELLLKLKQDILASSRFNVGNILRDNQEAKEFWEIHFGSENLSVPFTIFVQVLEEKNGRMRPQQVELFRNLLDANKDDKVTAYEFIGWLECFGNDINRVVINTFNSLLNLETGQMYDWFHVNIFKEQAQKKLRHGGFGSSLMRFSDIDGIFVVHCVGMDKTLCEFQLKSENNFYKLLHNGKINATEDLLFPYLESRANKVINKYAYFDTLTLFMWNLEDVFKIISLKVNLRYEPIDWKTGELDYRYDSRYDMRFKKFIKGEEKYKQRIYEKNQKPMPKSYEIWQNEIKDVEFKTSINYKTWKKFNGVKKFNKKEKLIIKNDVLHESIDDNELDEEINPELNTNIRDENWFK